MAGEPTQPDQTIAIVVRDGRVEGGSRRIEVHQGRTVEISVTADARDSIHLHGYDLTTVVEPNQEGVLTLTASIPAVFEVELEQSGVLILELSVR